MAAYSGVGRRILERPQKPVPYQHASSSLASGNIMTQNELYILWVWLDPGELLALLAKIYTFRTA